MEREFKDLLVTIIRYNKKADFKKIEKAWQFAKFAHEGHKRVNGEPYITHPLEVAHILADWKLDTTTIVAALLHDTLEDTVVKHEDLEKEFGDEVAYLVEGLTKVDKIKLKGSKEEVFVESLRKMILVMAKDLRVIFIKLADRIHNMETLSALSPESQLRNAKETLDLYAPLADRLNIGEAKRDLEDLSFPYAYPEAYEKVVKMSSPYYKRTEIHLEKAKRNLLKKLAKGGVKAEVKARRKHLYSLWKKLERPQISWDLEKVKDIAAIRILVKETSDCYKALGIVHQTYKPASNAEIKDYIAQPKPNGYRSIHTKITSQDLIIEVQIRTYGMEEQAEYGLAAHWAYAHAKSKGTKDEVLEKRGVFAPPDKLSWVKDLVKWQKEITDSEEFLRAVKFDALAHRNYIFSPKGDVYDLPAGATPVDFAFAVHTGLGSHIKGARVDGKLVSLDYKLTNGQVVEIMKSKNPKKPSRDWLNFVVTRSARQGIQKASR